MIHVIAVITARPGQRENVLQAFRANMPAVHAERGCIEYQPVADVSNFNDMQSELGENTFVVIEKWSDEDALKDHMASAHMASYAASVRDWIAERRVHVLRDA